MGNLYASDAFGWETEPLAKVVIAQSRVALRISDQVCPGEQLASYGVGGLWCNISKVAGYIPVINIITGTVIIGLALYDKDAFNGKENRPNNSAWWIGRGIAMICMGPLLFIVDLIKYIYDLSVAAKFTADNKALIDRFNTGHKHSRVLFCNEAERCLPAHNLEDIWVIYI